MFVVKKKDAKMFLDGPEVCHEYCRTDKSWFGTSMLMPGETGGIDPGHPGAHEAFYVCCGTVVMRNPDNNKRFELKEGDMLLVEDGEPHELTNTGKVIAIIAWCGGPTEPEKKGE